MSARQPYKLIDLLDKMSPLADPQAWLERIHGGYNVLTRRVEKLPTTTTTGGSGTGTGSGDRTGTGN